MQFLSVPPLSVTLHLFPWPDSRLPSRKPYILYPPLSSFLCYPMPSNAMRSCCCSWEGIGKRSERSGIPPVPQRFFQCYQFLIIHLFLLTYWLPTFPSNHRLDETRGTRTLCWSGCARVNTKYFNLWNIGVNVGERKTFVGIFAPPLKSEMKAKLWCLLSHCGPTGMDWEIQLTVFINFCLWGGVMRVRPRILGPTPFAALKRKQTWHISSTRFFFPFVSREAPLKARSLTQCNNQKLRNPQPPPMMSQNPQERSLLSWAQLQQTQFFLPVIQSLWQIRWSF